ncbi:MAG TPA: hypothetical protein DEB18_15040 [Leeuwenhoekiella sp.]|uniref:Uncharacterized protein n=2 Tax=Flavobacteriaceae TaxID=49546 RepID=A3XL28_LEEBM|nr:hypothetical protein MED217_01315 [Leeuwenhoekiella blandensis MED217]MAO43832.1 hypothetical protein [Leeuwenhoekiella sp.]HBT10686.1 hypothetical protein [Leeuwenhoekiella sp.]HCW64343.1 hypothetical protein [Leeuwenhoekiella sp.]|tara:strand:- start:1081 stop:1515 length:435 start_codon:yes stop_codon:yes gene_type:complete
MNKSMLRSILLSCGTALLALLYILAPLHQFVLEAAHDLEHEFDHITQSEHQHDFFSAEELLAEAGHDHRTLEYIKQVLEPFEDDLKKEQEKEKPTPKKVDKHLRFEYAVASPVVVQHFIKRQFDRRTAIHNALPVLQPVPPPEV